MSRKNHLSRTKRTLLIGAALLAPFSLFATSSASPVTQFHASLKPVPHDSSADNGSNVTGNVSLTRMGDQFTIDAHVSGLTPNLPHAFHIHGDLAAKNECPPASADVNTGDQGDPSSFVAGVPDGLVSLTEGAPFYGPVQVSFTTTGDTGAGSALVLERFASADSAGNLDYHRTFTIPNKISAKLGKLHVVIHGLDLNQDGSYSNFMEASLPVACGQIQPRG